MPALEILVRDFMADHQLTLGYRLLFVVVMGKQSKSPNTRPGALRAFGLISLLRQIRHKSLRAPGRARSEEQCNNNDSKDNN